ncbi:SGNH/GDSL hydrolase family protein [Bacillus sp. FJAT-49732]|uniref:SGNH/GDSL hydrolase family protein n=1 Tax=Lederbergia citrisecunda TaxID=2833583 RepID=A0A942TRN7_9BACI|nr:SGNH/GDSL hydrolase family protein [Lederbergia citrisecunda]MBS4200609.1 SGNH/GDSL hydrolase family protein [Lederbergia citrisecunda]
MRAFIATLAVLACAIFLAAGHFYWKDKTNISSFKAAEDIEVNREETAPVDEDEVQLKGLEIFGKTTNWPAQASEDFRKAVEDGRTYKLAFVGSPALGKEVGGWSVMLRDAIEDTYGKDNIEVGIFEYDLSSDRFIGGGHEQEIVDWKPDFILFEPFKWIDNKAAPQNNSGNIEKFMNALDKAGNKAVLVLQPPHPVFGTTHYPNQVGKLKEFAEEQHIEYWDHWTTWPDDESLIGYYLEDKSSPNEKGHQLWFKYLKEKFIAE